MFILFPVGESFLRLPKAVYGFYLPCTVYYHFTCEAD